MTTGQDVGSSRSELGLALDQLAAIERWHRTRAMRQHATDTAHLTREARLDLRRRMESRRREQEALIARSDAQLVQGRVARDHPRAVVVHRNEWMRTGIRAALADAGVEVVGELDNGADGLGFIVAEQPDLVLLEEQLPSVSGIELLAALRTLSPQSAVGAQVDGADDVRRVLGLGAVVAWTRAARPRQMAEELLAAGR